VNVMLIILFFGFFTGQFLTFKAFSIFVAAAFILITFAILDKMRVAGIKPKTQDLLVAGSAVLLILIFVSLVMTVYSGESPSDFEMTDYTLEFFVVILAFIVTFLTVVMGRLMGDHISHGWYFLAVLWHTLVDALAVYGIQTWNVYMVEGIIVLFGVCSLGIVFALRKGRQKPKEEVESETKPPLTVPSKEDEITSEKLENSRYE